MYRHLYVHVPFCRRRCSYCDFSIAVRREVPGAHFVDLVIRELTGCLEYALDDATVLNTVYLGGGTPSLLPLGELERLVGAVRDACPVSDSVEITIEANPDDVDVSVARGWKEAGINRVSLGAQSLQTQTLIWMHRTHTAGQVMGAIEALHVAAMPSVSADIIFGLPPELDADPVSDVICLIDNGVSHVSAYGLTVEPATAVGKWRAGGAVVQARDASFARQFLELHDRLGAHGFEHYEVSNYARPGHRSRHNRGYWSGASYLGIGPSAHSHASGVRWWNVAHWAEYERIMTATGDVIAGRETPDAAARWLETVYLALRTDGGLAPVNAQRLPAEALEKLVESGYLSQEADGAVRATVAGWLCLDEVVSVLTTSGKGG